MSELRCARLRIGDDKLQEMRDDGPVVSVPIAELVEARVVRTQTAERPIIQAVLGAGLTVLGVIWAVRIAAWLLADSGTLVDLEVLMLGWLVGGPLILWGALRRGVVLLARTKRTTRKLIVGKASLEELRSFAARAQADHGVRIELDASVTPS